MKVIAIAQRGTKKDFYDLFEIFKQTIPQKLKEWVLAKYGSRQIDCYHLLRSNFQMTLSLCFAFFRGMLRSCLMLG